MPLLSHPLLSNVRNSHWFFLFLCPFLDNKWTIVTNWMFNHHVLQLKVLNVIISYLYQTNLCLFFSLVEDIKAMFVCPTAFRFPPFFTFSETNESRILCFAHFAENHKSSVSRHWHFHSYLWQLFQPKPILMFQKDFFLSYFLPKRKWQLRILFRYF